MVEGSRCFASGELPGAAAAGPAGSTGSSSMTRRCIFVVVSALLVVIFVKEGCLLLFLLLPRYFKGLLFQDLPRLFNIFQNLSKSFFREGRWPSLLASSKIFQGLPFSRCSKIFQNLPEFSERLLLPKSPESFQPPFYFHDFPKLLLGAFLTFQKYSEILQEFFIGFPIHFTQGIGEEGSFDFRFDSHSCCICIYSLCVWLI